VPLTDQVRVDKEEIYDILDQMRATIPRRSSRRAGSSRSARRCSPRPRREAERIIKEARDEQSR
jgi:hypothetical protein